MFLLYEFHLEVCVCLKFIQDRNESQYQLKVFAMPHEIVELSHTIGHISMVPNLCSPTHPDPSCTGATETHTAHSTLSKYKINSF